MRWPNTIIGDLDLELELVSVSASVGQVLSSLVLHVGSAGDMRRADVSGAVTVGQV